jgi:hypothetical protein
MELIEKVSASYGRSFNNLETWSIAGEVVSKKDKVMIYMFEKRLRFVTSGDVARIFQPEKGI